MEENQFSNFETQQKLPNATAVLVLGIVSIVTCCCYGILGIVTGIVALVLAKKDTALYSSNPSVYTNYSQIKSGKVLAIIGIILSVLYLVYMVWIISYFGFEAIQNPELLQERLREMMRQ